MCIVLSTSKHYICSARKTCRTLGLLQGHGTYSYTTLKTILAKAKMDLRLDGITTKDIYLQKYIVDLVPAMKTGLDIVPQTKILPITNFTAEMPCNFIEFINDDLPPIYFTTNGEVDETAYYNYFRYSFAGYFLLDVCACAGFEPYWGVPVISIANGCITFSNTISATECTIRFMGLNVDDAGDMLIPQTNEAPIVAGVKYLYKYDEGFPESRWALDKQRWENGVKDRRGEANKPNPYQQQRINFIMSSMF